MDADMQFRGKNTPSVGLWKSVRVARLLNSESPGSVASLKVLESVNGDTGRSRGKLKKSRLLFRIPCADDLPEVLDNFILLLVSTIVGVLLPIINIDISNTTN